MDALTKPERDVVNQLVEAYLERQDVCLRMVDSLRSIFTENKRLKPLVHSMRWRIKDPEHLRDKLHRKLNKSKSSGEIFDITPDNLFQKINDLAGFRIVHLYTRQFKDIHPVIVEALEEAQTPIIEGPIARTWDDESRRLFEEMGIETQQSGDTLYTSVHYIVEANTRSKLTAEIQVRTIAEELWGEVDHTINYPHESKILACREQIKVLARVTSSCTRLVDSIFRTHEEGREASAQHDKVEIVPPSFTPNPEGVTRKEMGAVGNSKKPSARKRAVAK